jgi:hypothetical protein
MDPQLELEALKHVDGPLYTKHRDAWLASTPNAREILRRPEQQRDWRGRVTAMILLTWLDHRPEAERLLEQIDHAIDEWRKERGEPPTAAFPPWSYSKWSANHAEAHGWLFPLCWEAMLKRHKEWSYDKRWVFSWMLRGGPNAEMDELTVEVRFWYLRAIAETKQERSLGVYGLLYLPPGLIGPQVRWLQSQQRDLAALFKDDFPRLFPERPQ